MLKRRSASVKPVTDSPFWLVTLKLTTGGLETEAPVMVMVSAVALCTGAMTAPEEPAEPAEPSSLEQPTSTVPTRPATARTFAHRAANLRWPMAVPAYLACMAAMAAIFPGPWHTRHVSVFVSAVLRSW